MGERKTDTLRNKFKQKLFFHSFMIFFLAIMHMIMKEHIYKEIIFKKKKKVFGHVPPSFSITEAGLLGNFKNEIESGPLEFK